MKPLRTGLLVLVCLLGAPACRRGPSTSGGRILVDMDHRSVRVPATDQLQRVAILTSPAVQIAYPLGEAQVRALLHPEDAWTQR